MMLAFRLSMRRYRVSCMPGSHTANPTERAAWGCDERSAAPVFPDPSSGSFSTSKTFDLHRCPACPIGPEWIDLVQTWGVFGGCDSHGPLPLSGGWLDQMQWFADAHAILSRERGRYLDAVREEQRKGVKRGR